MALAARTRHANGSLSRTWLNVRVTANKMSTVACIKRGRIDDSLNGLR
jgi:hypothetical protein